MSKRSQPHNSLHIKQEDLGPSLIKLGEFLKKNKKVAAVFAVLMEGCGPCNRLKEGVLNPILNDSSRRMPIVVIQHDTLEHTPLKDLPIEGYPTLFLKKEDGSIEVIKNHSDLEAMKKTVGISSENALDYTDPNSPDESSNLDEFADEARDENAMHSNPMKFPLKESKMNRARPPPVNNDVLNSQNENSTSIEFETPKSGKRAPVGGSLYESLLEAGKVLGPAAILTTAAVASRIAISRKSKKGRSKRSKRSRRSRKN
jgi:hypothetical protein